MKKRKRIKRFLVVPVLTVALMSCFVLLSSAANITKYSPLFIKSAEQVDSVFYYNTGTKGTYSAAYMDSPDVISFGSVTIATPGSINNLQINGNTFSFTTISTGTSTGYVSQDVFLKAGRYKMAGSVSNTSGKSGGFVVYDTAGSPVYSRPSTGLDWTFNIPENGTYTICFYKPASDTAGDVTIFSNVTLTYLDAGEDPESKFVVVTTDQGQTAERGDSTVSIIVNPLSGFYDSFKGYSEASLKFQLGGNGLSQYLQTVGVQLIDTYGNVAGGTANIRPAAEDPRQNTTVIISTEELAKISDVKTIRFVYRASPDSDGFPAKSQFWFQASASITYNDYGAGEIAGSIQDSTDKITGGWNSDPQKPAGSDKVDELTGIENQLDQEISGGVQSGLDILQRFNIYVEKFEQPLLFIMGMFTDFFEVSWLTDLVTVSLSLGVIVFLLNLAPSVASRMHRDDMSERSETRHAESRARFEKNFAENQRYHNAMIAKGKQ